MKYEHVFSVRDAKAVPLDPIELASVGFMERQHLQEWIVANPSVLGEDVRIVAVEFDRWQTFSGDSKKDRLDILAIDSTGRLVVVELKRGEASSYVDLQVLKYAAAVSRFDPDSLVDAHSRFLASRGEMVTDEIAREGLEDHVGGALELEKLRQPRIVLVAHGFDESVTNTVVWLSESGLDIVLMRYQLYRTPSEPLFVISQLYPTPDTEEFTLTPRREEAEQAKAKAKSEQRQQDAVKILAAEGALEPGTRLHLDPSGINEDLRSQVAEWLAEDPRRGEGIWTGDPFEPIKWAYTGTRGKPSTFATQALGEATGAKRALNGSMWWRLDDGVSLAELAAQFIEAKKGAKDWTELHQILEKIPSDRWTTYGELAKVVGTAAQPLGKHLQDCPECTNAAHVLRSDGTSAPGFTWSDPNEHRTQRQVLLERGIRFGEDGSADRSQLLGAQHLMGLVDGATNSDLTQGV